MAVAMWLELFLPVLIFFLVFALVIVFLLVCAYFTGEFETTRARLRKAEAAQRAAAVLGASHVSDIGRALRVPVASGQPLPLRRRYQAGESRASVPRTIKSSTTARGAPRIQSKVSVFSSSPATTPRAATLSILSDVLQGTAQHDRSKQSHVSATDTPPAPSSKVRASYQRSPDGVVHEPPLPLATSDCDRDDADGHHTVRVGDRLFDGRFEVLKVLGGGTFAIVLHVLDRWSNLESAMKIVSSEHSCQIMAQDEVFFLQLVKKFDFQSVSNCIMLEDYAYLNGHKVMLFPHVGLGLRTVVRRMKRLRGTRAFSESAVRSIMRQLTAALKFLHDDVNIIHADLKLDNIIMVFNRETIAEDGIWDCVDPEVKIIDFGLATLKRRPDTHILGTCITRAPEMILLWIWNQLIDVFALGCIGIELFTGNVAIDLGCDYVVNGRMTVAGRIAHLNLLESVLGAMPQSMVEQAAATASSETLFTDVGVQPRRKGKAVVKGLRQNEVNYFGHKQPPLAWKKQLTMHHKRMPDFQDFLEKMLAWDPAKRSNAKALLAHNFLAT